MARLAAMPCCEVGMFRLVQTWSDLKIPKNTKIYRMILEISLGTGKKHLYISACRPTDYAAPG